MAKVIVANITWNDAGWTDREVHPEARHRNVKDKPGHECLNFIFNKKNIDSDDWVNGYFKWTNAPTSFENRGLIIFCSTDIHDWQMKIVGVYGGAEILDYRRHPNYPGFEDGNLITNVRGKVELSMRFPVYLQYNDFIRSKKRPGEVGFSYINYEEAISIIEEEIKQCKQLPQHKESIMKLQMILSHFSGKPSTQLLEEVKKQQVEEEQVQEKQIAGLSEEEMTKQLESYKGDDNLTDEKPAVRATVTVYERDGKLSALMKSKADFLCQLCGHPTFESSNGNNYVESHHVIPRGTKGSDDPRNIIIVCPNCHSKFDFGSEKVKIQTYQLLRNKGLFSRFDILKERGIISQKVYDEIMK